eukprot:10950610-Alexandrium_andersonii.AAC.1
MLVVWKGPEREARARELARIAMTAPAANTIGRRASPTEARLMRPADIGPRHISVVAGRLLFGFGAGRSRWGRGCRCWRARAPW